MTRMDYSTSSDEAHAYFAMFLERQVNRINSWATKDERWTIYTKSSRGWTLINKQIYRSSADVFDDLLPLRTELRNSCYGTVDSYLFYMQFSIKYVRVGDTRETLDEFIVFPTSLHNAAKESLQRRGESLIDSQ